MQAETDRKFPESKDNAVKSEGRDKEDSASEEITDQAEAEA